MNFSNKIYRNQFYGDLVNRFRKIVGKSKFSEQFRKLISRYKRVGYSRDIMRQTACLVINPIIVDGYASLFRFGPQTQVRPLRKTLTSGLGLCFARRGSHLLWHTVELAMSTRLCLL